MLTYGMGYGMGSVVNAKFGFSLLQVGCEQSSSPSSRRPATCRIWSPIEAGAARQFAGRQPAPLTDPADLWSNDPLQTNDRERCAHEEYAACLLRRDYWIVRAETSM